jgi:hypothetical protein
VSYIGSNGGDAKLGSIRIVLHGGLGNQLFQYFVGRVEQVQRGGGITLHAELLQRYGTARGLELSPLLEAPSEADVDVTPIGPLARARVPKLLQRMGLGDRVLRVPGWGRIVDGYFHRADEFAPFGPAARAHVLQDWRQALAPQGLLLAAHTDHLMHLRLGDFFKSRDRARAFAVDRLRGVGAHTDVVTDQEDLIGELISELPEGRNLTVIPSAALSAWELFSLMSGYRTITTNGSSLAFWAAVLGERTLESTNPEHVALSRQFGQG